MLRAILLSTALAAFALSAPAGAADLRMSWWGGDSRHVQTQEALKVCGAKLGHNVKAEFTGFQGHLEKLTTQLAGGTEADIMQMNWPWLPLFSKKGDGFADLNQFSKIIDLKQFGDILQSGTVNGKLNGIPVSTTGRVFMFNKDTFDKAGLPLPTTWDELIADAKVFKDKLGPDFYPFDAMGGASDRLNAVLTVQIAVAQATGKSMIDPVAMKINWTPEELTKGIEFWVKLVDTGTVRSWKSIASLGKVELYDTRPWAEGKVAGSYEWDSTYSKFADPLKGQKLTPVQPLVLKDAKSKGMYRKPSMLISISKRSKNPEAAAQVVNCLLNDPDAVKVLGDSRGIPASKVAFETLKAANKIGGPVADANATVMSTDGPAVTPFDENPRIRELFMTALETVAYGQAKPKEVAKDLIADWNSILERM